MEYPVRPLVTVAWKAKYMSKDVHAQQLNTHHTMVQYQLRSTLTHLLIGLTLKS